jgi:hypothetical protein
VREGAPYWRCQSRRAGSHLETNQGRISFYLSAGGPVFSVTDKSGTVLVDKATREEIRARLPEMSQFVDDALAQVTVNVDEDLMKRSD